MQREAVAKLVTALCIIGEKRPQLFCSKFSIHLPLSPILRNTCISFGAYVEKQGQRSLMSDDMGKKSTGLLLTARTKITYMLWYEIVYWAYVDSKDKDHLCAMVWDSLLGLRWQQGQRSLMSYDMRESIGLMLTARTKITYVLWYEIVYWAYVDSKDKDHLCAVTWESLLGLCWQQGQRSLMCYGMRESIGLMLTARTKITYVLWYERVYWAYVDSKDKDHLCAMTWESLMGLCWQQGQRSLMCYDMR